jgi:hypothetical protein
MIRRVPTALALLVAIAAPLAAQAPAPDATEPEVTAPAVAEPLATANAPKTMVGNWEFSNADREKICTVTFRPEAGAIGKKVEFDQACAGPFPFVSEVVGWTLAENDFLRLLDAQGHSVLEFSEVEGGIYEAPKSGEGILFIQNAAALGPAPKTADQMTGEWNMVRRTGSPICALTLSSSAVGEEFAVRVHPPCDASVRRFAPATWQMDRGEIVLRSPSGQSWRFEETEDSKWRRIPQTANPVLLVRK